MFIEILISVKETTNDIKKMLDQNNFLAMNNIKN